MKIRPKVRYVVRTIPGRPFPDTFCVRSMDPQTMSIVCEASFLSRATRIAAALNLAEAVRRGEVKVSK